MPPPPLSPLPSLVLFIYHTVGHSGAAFMSFMYQAVHMCSLKQLLAAAWLYLEFFQLHKISIYDLKYEF